tara:strand:+ start:830 stop:997 length:168 start_codon:yes stop_codon:yes gene_type:complete
MHINTVRQLLTEQGWEVVSTNSRNGRFYHAEHVGMKRSFSGRKDFFKAQAEQFLA